MRLVQKITGEIQTGKSTVLRALARGFVSGCIADNPRKVAYVVPEQMDANWFRDMLPSSVDIMSYTDAIERRRLSNGYEVILIDDTEQMPTEEGFIVDLALHMYRHSEKPLSVFYTALPATTQARLSWWTLRHKARRFFSRITKSFTD